jgi:hypothetical protein
VGAPSSASWSSWAASLLIVWFTVLSFDLVRLVHVVRDTTQGL